MKTLNKQKLGDNIYKMCLIVVTIILILLLIFFNDVDIESATFYRYMVFFYCFGGILSIGSICKELLSGVYKKTRMQIKIIATAVILITGTILFITIKNDVLALILLFVSIFQTLFVCTPTETTKSN